MKYNKSWRLLAHRMHRKVVRSLEFALYAQCLNSSDAWRMSAVMTCKDLDVMMPAC